MKNRSVNWDAVHRHAPHVLALKVPGTDQNAIYGWISPDGRVALDWKKGYKPFFIHPKGRKTIDNGLYRARMEHRRRFAKAKAEAAKAVSVAVASEPRSAASKKVDELDRFVAQQEAIADGILPGLCPTCGK